MCQTLFLVHELQRRTGQVPAPNAPSFQWTTQWLKVHKQIEQHNFQWCPFSGENKTAHCDREGLPGKDDLESLSRRKLSLEISPEPQECPVTWTLEGRSSDQKEQQHERPGQGWEAGCTDRKPVWVEQGE